MNNPFFNTNDLTSSELLKLVGNHQFEEPIYHSDEYGHIQVEQPPQKVNYSLDDLILLIEERKLWQALIEKLSAKDDAWLMEFLTAIQKQRTMGVFHCLVQLSSLIKDDANQVFQYQDVNGWPWQFGSILLLEEIEHKNLMLKQRLINQGADISEIYLSIVKDTLISLQLLKDTLA
jgi:hypothetical protein|tara:strand:+ start:3121 stop:3648 length:528 start_codon:yes stop_codon:yes gene_type:complete